MNKKKLNSLTFESIKSVCLRILEDWIEYDNDSEPSLDKEFLLSLKELRVLIDRVDKEHRNIALSRLQSLSDKLSPRSYSEIESNFKALSRSILALAQSLASSRELKDFFVVSVEKILEPLKQMQLDKGESEKFLKAYTEAVTDDVLIVDEQVKKTLRKLMATLTPCILVLY